MVNIFKDGKVMNVSWFYFKKVGDEIQGTYAGRSDKPVKDNFGQDQIVVSLESSTGITKIGFKPYSRVIKNMQNVKRGQIIGFKFEGHETKFNSKVNKDVTYKVISLYADPKMIDADWISRHPNGVEDISMEEEIVNATKGGDEDMGGEEEEGGTSGFGSFDSPVPTETPSNGLTLEETLKQIAELAKTKLGAIVATQVKDKVMEATGLPFLPVNYTKILDILKTL